MVSSEGLRLELLAKFFQTQKETPSKGDWINTVGEILIKEFGIKEDLNSIRHLKKTKFKEIVKAASKKVAFQKLNISKEKHSKSKVLSLSELTIKQKKLNFY